MHAHSLYDIIRAALQDAWKHKVPRLGAALAFYSSISLGPLLLIIVSISGLALGHEGASEQFLTQIEGLVGEEGARAVKTILTNAATPHKGMFAPLIGIVTLFLSATGVFGQLQDALNTIWEVKAKPDRGILWILRERFLSFTLVLGIGFLLLISLVISTALNALGDNFIDSAPDLVLQLVNFVVSFGFITLLFALIFKVLPDARIRWRDVWVGAIITAAFFNVGKLGIGLYLGHSAISTTYGAAGSFVILLLWIYYSSLILFFGAELTQAYARYHHHELIMPARGAKPAPT
jgi:membrane protein